MIGTLADAPATMINAVWRQCFQHDGRPRAGRQGLMGNKVTGKWEMMKQNVATAFAAFLFCLCPLDVRRSVSSAEAARGMVPSSLDFGRESSRCCW
jgi:hypothetical protein